MHALFFMSDSLKLDGVEDRSIHIFESEEAADAWLLEKLIAAGVVTKGQDAGYWWDDEFYSQPADVLDAIREDHEGEGDFVHAYPAVDHRGSNE